MSAGPTAAAAAPARSFSRSGALAGEELVPGAGDRREDPLQEPLLVGLVPLGMGMAMAMTPSINAALARVEAEIMASGQ